jgi:uncharacterized protein (TIGR03084 family)
MGIDMPALAQDLAAETADLNQLLDRLGSADWARATPAPGWSIADQVSHLAYFDDAALTAATAPDTFRTHLAQVEAAGGIDPDAIAAGYRHLTPDLLRDWFDESRSRVLDVYADLDPTGRQPWYGPDMSAASALSARLMETWAHTQDIADALGAARVPTRRLRHIAHLAVAARAYSFTVRGLPVPDAPVRVELTAPDGSAWAWGPEGAADRITGPALDFCLVTTQRRHPADTMLAADGPAAQAWIAIAQAFAGPPGPGRRPGQFDSVTSPGRR